MKFASTRKEAEAGEPSSTQANWTGQAQFGTFGRMPGDSHMQAAIASMLLGHGVLRGEWRARPKTGGTPIQSGVLSQNFGEARLPDRFSQKQFDSLIQFAEEFRFSLGGERRRLIGIESLP